MKMTCPHCKKPSEVSVTIKPPTKEELIEFEIFRDNYKGKKRGLITEMNNFVKKHTDWREVLMTLNRLYIDFGTESKYIPHFQTFINQRQWEMFDIKSQRKTKPYVKEFNWRKDNE